jgi:4,5-dihydroxyphthalate decarboxylase
MTPFMPPGFHHPDSPFRPLYRDSRVVELDYYGRTGFVPGIHLLALRREVLDRRPGIAQELVDLFERSKAVSRARRDKLMDVTPWHNLEVDITTRVFGRDWMPYGVARNRSMVAAFQDELVAQGLLAAAVPEADLFPVPVDPSIEGQLEEARA